ncbi:hypothetical protein QNH39_02370 [Neobacillus novalis]|uniref:Uncharacterized protein n=1 Tax=Neobacillus novalis TaxID=220687 RepID=A0AA95SBC5_9BACI|nr:hypothetical protein [Neobacillus novalis]WHY86742.1 hypothetical protein QNH39_02370 [Neobacillus novalis]
MENKLINLKDKMNETLLRDIYFNDKLEQSVLSSIKNKKSRVFPFRNKFNSLLSLAVTTVFFLGIAYFVATQLNLFKDSQGNNASVPKEKIIETTNNETANTSFEEPNAINKDDISKETVFSELKKYLPQNVLDNMPNFRQEDLNESTLYLWSKKEPNSDNFIHKIEVIFNENGFKQYHYKNYSFDLKENKISKDVANKMVENFAKSFISDGDQLSFVNKPAWDSLYEKDVVESWVSEKDNKEYIVMVNLSYGYVEFFTIQDKSN